ncbi:T9SS type A sorting domain-containing protein [Sabulilitoribacter arenilitoris]|uniref:T9SS type A sorting domain-containing protein n=1 Tax=Wocania arenilitoris TaxID=2044858 RepID=A0AAE3EM02_9FLAO|nr:T9SS type A sorting domain-containing protein [Wocania arenilitoris]MCF7566897.1 T9SS type A sorting domain-containing protein [Wocania arenilitoris]
MKKITLLILLSLTFNFGVGQTALSEGEIAITGVNADNPDQFSFVLLTDISNTTQINFTDFGWISTGGFYTVVNEGIVSWTANSNLPCGTEIVIENIGSGNFSATSGTALLTDAGFNLSGTGDQLLAYQGNLTSPTFISAVHFGNSVGWTDATNTNTSAVPSGLTDGTNAVYIGNIDNGIYDCSATSNQTLILVGLNDNTNWSGSNTIRQTLASCAYACVAIGSCASTVTWNGTTWVGGTPDLTTEVNIDANYDTGNGGSEVSFKACSLTINNGAILTVDNGTYIEVENDVLVNDGQLRVNTQANFVQNDNNGTFTLGSSGTASVNKVTAIKQNWFYYTYWSSPVVGETIADAFPDTDNDRRFWFNAANYIDEHTVGTTNGIPDDIDDNNDDWSYALGTDVMNPGVGYATTSGRLGFFPRLDTADFIGSFNTGNINTPVVNNPLNVLPAYSWNFIGNPYPSAIDFIAFQQANSSIVDGTAYFWSQSLPLHGSNPGNQVANFNQNDYATFTVGTGGAAGANGIIPTQYIPSAQGFFIAGLSNGNATFTNAMRMADETSNSQFFKGSNSKKNTTTVANKLWIDLASNNGVFNQVLVGYVEGATKGNDGMSYDAPKLLSNVFAALYTSMENSDKKFAIQGKAPSDLNENEIIDLGFITSIDVETLYTLSIAQLEGDYLNNNTIYLKDNLLDKLHDLSDSDYTFTSEIGEFNTRFQIVFTNKALSTNDSNLNNNRLTIIELDDNHVNFKMSNSLTIKKVTIYDLLGRELYNLKGENSSETYELSKLKSTIYIAKVELSNGEIITKKTIKR